MEGFRAAFLNEIDKLLKKKKIFAAALLSIVAVVIGQIAVTIINSSWGLRFAGSTEFPLVVLSVFSYTLLPLFSAFVVIDMFSGEFSSNTMKITLTRPVSRFDVFCAKATAVACFILANLIFVMILSLAAGAIFNPSSQGALGVVRVILSYLSMFWPVFTVSILVVVISNVIRSGVAAFFVSVLVFIGLIFLGIFFSRYSSFFVTSTFRWYQLWISDSMDLFKILRQFFIMLGCGIMFFTAGYYLFDKKDL